MFDFFETLHYEINSIMFFLIKEQIIPHIPFSLMNKKINNLTLTEIKELYFFIPADDFQTKCQLLPGDCK